MKVIIHARRCKKKKTKNKKKGNYEIKGNESELLESSKIWLDRSNDATGERLSLERRFELQTRVAVAAVSAAPQQLPAIKQIIRSSERTRRTSSRVVPSSSNQSYQRLIADAGKKASVDCRL